MALLIQKIVTYNMESYHLVHSFHKLTLVMVGSAVSVGSLRWMMSLFKGFAAVADGVLIL